MKRCHVVLCASHTLLHVDTCKTSRNITAGLHALHEQDPTVGEFYLEGLLLHLDPPWTAACWDGAVDVGLGQGPSAPWRALATCLDARMTDRGRELVARRGWWGAVHFAEAGGESVLLAAKAQVAVWMVGTCCVRVCTYTSARSKRDCCIVPCSIASVFVCCSTHPLHQAPCTPLLRRCCSSCSTAVTRR